MPGRRKHQPKTVRYDRNLGFEEKKVEIYDNADRIREHMSNNDHMKAGPETQTCPPGRRTSLRSAALVLGAMCVLMAAAIIVLSALYISVRSDRGRVGTVEQQQDTSSNSCNQSENELKRLQDQITDLEANNRRLQEEAKGLKVKTKECADAWRRFGCSCYFTSSERKTWPEARRQCESRETDLVVINSREEQDFVTGLVKGDRFWIGLRAVQNPGAYKWEWVDETLPETFWTTGLSVEPTEPYVAACCDQGTFTQMRYDGAEVHTYVCEK